MLDNGAWVTLIESLITHSRTGKLKWTRNGTIMATSGAAAFRSAFGTSVLKKISLTAKTKSTQYDLTAESGGRAPYSLTVHQIGAASTKLVGTVQSSTMMDLPAHSQVNRALASLFEVVNGTVEDPKEVLDRLLGDLDDL